jgi:hypothetical protein
MTVKSMAASWAVECLLNIFWYGFLGVTTSTSSGFWQHVARVKVF